MTITPERLAELKRLEAAATKGENGWHEYIDDENNVIAISYQYRGPNGGCCRGEIAKMPVPSSFTRLTQGQINDNARFSIAARNHLRELIGAAEENASLRTQLAEARAEIERLKTERNY